jgi:hypothetical protein
MKSIELLQMPLDQISRINQTQPDRKVPATARKEAEKPAASVSADGGGNRLPEWKPYERFLFRFAFCFLLVFCLPTDPKWYQHLFHIDWAHLHARDLYDLAHIEPHFVKISPEGRWGWGGFLNWLWIGVGSLVVALIWTVLDRHRREYHMLYYWLRVLVRYRAALGIIGFSFEKIFPTQMPYPSLAHLSTAFGDFSGHKIYWTLIGVLPSYQVFGGFVELIPGILLLFRKTATLGAALLVGALLTIAMANLGYDGGVHVYASYFVLLGLFLLLKDIPAIYQLLIRERFTRPAFQPVIDQPWVSYARVAVKASFVVYIVVFAYLQFLNFRYDPYKQVSTAGVKALRGSYEVAEFRLNNQVIPYSPLNSLRWQDVAFEDWTTLSFRVNRPLNVELSNSGGGVSSSGTAHTAVEMEKNYEGAGVAGGRRMFHYYADTAQQLLYLIDKNLTAALLNKTDRYPQDWIQSEVWNRIGDDNHKIAPKAFSTRRDRDYAKSDKKLIRDKMVLHYQITKAGQVILSGTDENLDSLYVVLNKIENKFVAPQTNIHSGTY